MSRNNDGAKGLKKGNGINYNSIGIRPKTAPGTSLLDQFVSLKNQVQNEKIECSKIYQIHPNKESQKKLICRNVASTFSSVVIAI